MAISRYDIALGKNPPVIEPVAEKGSAGNFDDLVLKPTFEKYHGVMGETHRCGLVYTDPKAMFAASRIHYANGRFFNCKEDRCCEVCGPAKWRIGTVLIQYVGGGIVRSPFDFELKPWVFGETIYRKFKILNDRCPVANHDFKIECTNNEYQQLYFSPCRISRWQMSKKWKRNILKDVDPLWDYVKRSIAVDLSIEEIHDLLRDIS